MEVSDPVVLKRGENGDFKALVSIQGDLEEREFQEVSDKEIEDHVQVIRVRGDLTLLSLKNESDLQSGIKHLIEKVSDITWH